VKTFFKLGLGVLLFITIKSSAQGILIDHHCTDVNQIPLTVIADIKQNIKFQWAHTSHGEQLFCGLELLETQFPELNVAIGTGAGSYGFGGYLPQEPGAMCVFDGVVGWDLPGECCTYITHEGFWMENGPSWVASTFSYNPTLNVTGWIWCDQLDTCSAAFVQEYLSQMEAFELLYPNVTFIYTTGNAQAGWEEGYNRHLRCNEIRNYCAANSKILFDFEDMDCWYNGQMNYYIYNNDTVPVQHSAYNGDDCGHVNNISTLQKGKAVWWMMARIRGWQQDSPGLNLRVFMEGAFNGSAMQANLNGLADFPLVQPYSVSPWNYNGTESVTAIPFGVVDWVLLEYRDAPTASAATSSTTIRKQAAFLRNDGNIVGLDGASGLPFNESIINQLFIVVRHRNHLGIMSANPAGFDGSQYSYDFTNSPGKAFGSNSQKDLGGGYYGMFMGDMDANGTIEQNDLIRWKLESGNHGYYSSDLNLSKQVNNLDKNEYWKANSGKSSQVPQ
jgi:hypothetical protein